MLNWLKQQFVALKNLISHLGSSNESLITSSDDNKIRLTASFRTLLATLFIVGSGTALGYFIFRKSKSKLPLNDSDKQAEPQQAAEVLNTQSVELTNPSQPDTLETQAEPNKTIAEAVNGLNPGSALPSQEPSSPKAVTPKKPLQLTVTPLDLKGIRAKTSTTSPLHRQVMQRQMPQQDTSSPTDTPDFKPTVKFRGSPVRTIQLFPPEVQVEHSQKLEEQQDNGSNEESYLSDDDKKLSF